MASANQKRAQADMAAFVAVHGRRPRKGESIKGYSGGASARAAAPKGSKGAKSSARSRGARKAARTRSKLTYRLKRFVKNHPVATTAIGLGAAGGTAYVASEAVRDTVRSSLSR